MKLLADIQIYVEGIAAMQIQNLNAWVDVVEEVARFNGSKLEQLIMLFCKQAKLRYNKLTEEEKQWLTRIARKSELLNGSMPQRGKGKR